MQEIAQYESAASFIKQRRHSADVAFEKEKKLLSLLSIRKQQIEKLQEEEKQDALIRNEERKSISMQQCDLEDTIRSTRYQSFADSRFQEYVIRKEVASEMERKFSAQIDDIKSQLTQKQRRRSSVEQSRGKDVDAATNSKSTGSRSPSESPEYAFDDEQGHGVRLRDHNRSVSFAEDQDLGHEQEEKQDIVHHEADERTNDEEEGNQTVPISNEFRVQRQERDRAERVSAISILENQQNQNEQVMERQKVDSTTTTGSVEVDSLETNEIEAQNASNRSSLTLPVLSSDSESDGNMNDKAAANDTSQIERAVGQIEIDHGKREQSEVVAPAPMTISITTENDEEKMYQSPKQKAHPPSRSFRARTSKNRVLFSVLASPTQNSEDAIGSVTHTVGIRTETIPEDQNRNLVPKLSAVECSSTLH